MDPLWSKHHCFEAASFYATALCQGYNLSESDGLAQVFIMKKVYPGLVYSDPIESKLKKIMALAETT